MTAEIAHTVASFRNVFFFLNAPDTQIMVFDHPVKEMPYLAEAILNYVHMSQTVMHTQDYSRGLMFESLFVRKLSLYKALASK